MEEAYSQGVTVCSDGREGLLHNKPVQGLRLTNCITGFMLNQLKIDRSLYQLGVLIQLSVAPFLRIWMTGR